MSLASDVAKIPLRGAPKDQVETALAQVLAAFSKIANKAWTLGSFLEAAKVSGTHKTIEEDMAAMTSLMLGKGILKPDTPETKPKHSEMPPLLAEKAIQTAEAGIKLARAVVLHSAIEEALIRLCRIGAVLDRAKAVKETEQQRITLRELSEMDKDTLLDRAIEKWLDDLGEGPVLKKWDALVRLVGHPTDFNSGTSHFDRKYLEAFDDARNDAVHADGDLLNAFDLDEFESQLTGVPLKWQAHVCEVFGLTMDPKKMFFMKELGDKKSADGNKH